MKEKRRGREAGNPIDSDLKLIIGWCSGLQAAVGRKYLDFSGSLLKISALHCLDPLRAIERIHSVLPNTAHWVSFEFCKFTALG